MIAWAGDIHFNHCEQAARDAFIEQVQMVAPSCLLLAGDIGESRTAMGFIDEIERLVKVPVRYVLGNHDFYRGSIPKVRELHRADRRYLHESPTPWPLGPGVELVGVDGWGDGGWAPSAFGQIRLSDFHMIREFSRAPDRRIVAEGLGRESAGQLRHQRGRGHLQAVPGRRGHRPSLGQLLEVDSGQPNRFRLLAFFPITGKVWSRQRRRGACPETNNLNRRKVMGHGITSTDRFAEVRKHGQRAWHGLGDELEEGLDFQQSFQNKGLGWATDLAPIFAKVGDTTIELPDNRAHIRRDNGYVLGVVSDRYKAFENMDVARFADGMLGADAAVTAETVGSLYGGRRIFALARLPGSFKLGGDDEVRPFLLVSNGHGGFAGFNTYLTTIRVVCDNTLTLSERDLARGVSFRHVGNLDEKLKQARLILGLADRELAAFNTSCQRLAATAMSPAQVQHFMETLWEQTFGVLDTEDTEAYEKAVAKRDEIVGQWLANMEDEKQKLAGIEGTAWAAYNAVSQWHDHQRGRFLSVAESDARVHSNLFGASNRDKQRAFRSALQLTK